MPIAPTLRRLRPILTMGLVCALLVGVIWYAMDRKLGPFTGDSCFARATDGRTVELDLDQAENAALIAAIAMRRGLPARAVTIALATAIQESKIINVDYGDRDSLGLFQQRPSQGWGSEQEVQDPTYATNAFYDALEKVPDYRTLAVTVAAQKVQRSAYPDAYADHEEDARILASALTGNSRAAFWCEISAPDAGPTALTDTGLTMTAQDVRDEVSEVFGSIPVGGFEPGGVATGHMSKSAHYSGRAVDFFFRPINGANKRAGWALASWLVAHADRLGIRTVIFDDRIWQAGASSDEGWRNYAVPSTSSGDRKILEHRDHVHMDVP